MTLAPYPTTVFPKKTHTNLFLDFSSHHTLARKVTVTRTMLTKQDLQFLARQRCGQGAFLQILETSGYPKPWSTNTGESSHPPFTSQQDMPRATIVLPILICAHMTTVLKTVVLHAKHHRNSRETLPKLQPHEWLLSAIKTSNCEITESYVCTRVLLS